MFMKLINILVFCALFFGATKVEALELEMDTHCLAQNIYFEAGNQPLAGKIAVVNVVLNRVEHDKFPNNVCDVVYQTKEWRTSWTGKTVPKLGMCQFSWFCDGKSDKPKDSKTWAESLQLADDMLVKYVKNDNYLDLTEGAMWYHAYYIQPYWSHHLNETVQISAHIFYR